MKKKIISLLLAGGMILSMAACGNSGQEVSQSQTGGSESSTAGSSEVAGGSETAGSSEVSAPANDFTYPMEPVTFTFNGSGSGGTDYYDDNEHPAWAKDIYIHKVMRDKTGVSLTDIGGAAGSTTMSEQFLLMLASGELPDIINAPWNAYTGGAAAAIEEGYIVDKSTVQAKFSNGEAGVSIQQSSNIQNCLSANEGTGYEVLALESLVMNKGDEPEFAQQSIQHYDGGMCYAVSTTCPDIEAACRYLDWRFSEEGLMTMNYGIEGVTYEVVNGEVQLTDLILHNEETPVANSARDEIAQNRNRAGVSLDISLAYTDQQKEWIDVWTAHMDEYVLPTVPYTAEQQDTIGKNWGNVDDYCQEMILKYIVGSSDISEWDSLVSTIKGMEIDKVLAAKQEAYDDYLQRVEELKK